LEKFFGVAVSEGIAIGPCYRLDNSDLDIQPAKSTDAVAEWQRAQEAKTRVAANLQKQLAQFGDDPHAEILQAHLTILNDPELAAGIENAIQTQHDTAEYAVSHNILSYADMLESLPDEYLRERAQDLRDLRIQWLSQLLGKTTAANVQANSVIYAPELLPSQFLQVRSVGIAGIITEQGGSTSHVAILARNFGIPMVTGLALTDVVNGTEIALDGQSGQVIVAPDAQALTELTNTRDEYEKMMKNAYANRHLEAKTKAGQLIEVAANIGSPNDLAHVLENGADGVGLFRTEFLFMDRKEAPTEDEQYEAYKQVAQGLSGKRVVIRTLDAGADKKVAYLQFDEEENPFLGVRGLRYTLKQPTLFQTQLKAILRAADHGNIALMFPMVTSVADVEAALAAVDEAKGALKAEGKSFGEVELGAMIEVPAAALITDLLAEKLDFVSVGTNDLIQYTTASDRMNPEVTKWYDPSHPGLWRLLEQVAKGAHAHGAWVGMCGELAGTLEFVPRLIELGYDELSMSPKRIGLVKTTIRAL
jgi:phosphotransferase system enzyme I (PtsI)